MAISKAQIKATEKYNAKSYERLTVRVKIGEAKKIQAYAESKGKSLNGFINELIYNAMEQGN